MNTKTIPYGTTKKVKVVSIGKHVLIVEDDNNEGYALMGHGLDITAIELSEEGTITFVQNNGPTKGHWEYKKGE